MAEKGGHWVKSAGGGMSFRAAGGGSGNVTDEEWAAGVRSARDAGGQVPQSAVDRADKILRAAGKMPIVKNVKTLTKDQLTAYYRANNPQVGDRWNIGKGGYAEVTDVRRVSGGVAKRAVGINFVGQKKGYSFDIYLP